MTLDLPFDCVMGFILSGTILGVIYLITKTVVKVQSSKCSCHTKKQENMKNFFSDLLGQIWTLLGMFVAWIVLEGSAKIVVGWCILVSLVIWVVTYAVRKNDQSRLVSKVVQILVKHALNALRGVFRLF